MIVNILVLVMPIAAIGVLGIYETELLRRTESELISQVALIEAQYREALREEIEASGLSASLGHYGIAVDAAWASSATNQFRPILPALDPGRDTIYPPQGDPEPPRGAVDPIAQKVGARQQEVLREAQKITLSGMRIVDIDGNVVASTSTSEQNMSVFHHEEIERALRGEVVKLMRERGRLPAVSPLAGLSRQTRMRIFIAKPVVLEGRVVGAVAAWRTPMNLGKGLYENRFVFGGLLAVILLGGLTITGLTAFYIGWPIRRLINQTEEIAAGDSDARKPIRKPGTFEVQQLSQAMAEMATTLESRALYIKTFARNVSHEFKTPLTTIRGTVELLQDHIEEMEPEKREEFLAILDADAYRLERLVGRLLELARAYVQRPTGEALAIEPILERMCRGAGDGDFIVTLHLSDEAIDVSMEEEVFESIVSNFLVNARQHGASKLDVRVDVDDGKGSFTMLFSDDGPGISEGNAEKVFEDFFTTARDAGGTGLGLSIVRTLVTAHEGQVKHVPTVHGATFRLVLPLAEL